MRLLTEAIRAGAPRAFQRSLIARRIPGPGSPYKGTEAIRIADSAGVSVTTDIESDGTISHALHGRSPQGEASTLPVCATLVRRLNAGGADWGLPEAAGGQAGRREEGIDCEARSRTGGAKLYIQVVRADSDQEQWRKLGRHGQASNRSDIVGETARLRRAIEKKAKRIAPAQRRELVLALNASDLPHLATSIVAASFRQRNGAWARGLGFQGVWVVGPIEGLAEQLDNPEAEQGSGAP